MSNFVFQVVSLLLYSQKNAGALTSLKYWDEIEVQRVPFYSGQGKSACVENIVCTMVSEIKEANWCIY